MRTAPGLWRSLEALTPAAAVLAEWGLLTGSEFDQAGAFLRPANRLALSYPCTGQPRCACRHEVVDLDDGRIIAPWRKATARQIKVQLNASLQTGDGDDAPENPETLTAALEAIRDDNVERQG
jgi:hypothetical protein